MANAVPVATVVQVRGSAIAKSVSQALPLAVGDKIYLHHVIKTNNDSQLLIKDLNGIIHTIPENQEFPIIPQESNEDNNDVSEKITEIQQALTKDIRPEVLASIVSYDVSTGGADYHTTVLNRPMTKADSGIESTAWKGEPVKEIFPDPFIYKEPVPTARDTTLIADERVNQQAFTDDIDLTPYPMLPDFPANVRMSLITAGLLIDPVCNIARIDLTDDFSFGFDGPGPVFLTPIINGSSKDLYTNGLAVPHEILLYNGVENTIYGVDAVNHELVFTALIEQNTKTFYLFQFEEFNHDAKINALNDFIVQLDLDYTVVDGNGNSVTRTISTFTFDDNPFVGISPKGTVTDLMEPRTVNGVLNYSMGKDENGIFVLDVPNRVLKSEGHTLTYDLYTVNQYIRLDGEIRFDPHTVFPVFSLVIDPIHMTYQYTQENLMNFDDESDTDNGILTFTYRIIDGDNDTASGSFTLDAFFNPPHLPNIIDGTDQDDAFLGTPANDLVHLKDGNDILGAVNGFNDGNDIIYGENGSDVLRGGAGNDILYGGNDSDLLLGQEDHDRLYGEAGDDILAGGPGNDQLYGGSGNDRMLGQEGNDWIFAGTDPNENDEIVYTSILDGHDIIEGFDNLGMVHDEIDLSILFDNLGIANDVSTRSALVHINNVNNNVQLTVDGAPDFSITFVNPASTDINNDFAVGSGSNSEEIIVT